MCFAKHFIMKFCSVYNITLHYVRTQKSAYDSLSAGKQSARVLNWLDRMFFSLIETKNL